MNETWVLFRLLLSAAWLGNDWLAANDLFDLNEPLAGMAGAPRGLAGLANDWLLWLGSICAWKPCANSQSLHLTVNAAGKTPTRPLHSPYSQPSSVRTWRSTLMRSPIWRLSSSSRLASNWYSARNLLAFSAAETNGFYLELFIILNAAIIHS